MKKIFFLLLILFYVKFICVKKKIKVCVCSCGKNENAYAKEFVQHYAKFGVDIIYIYDNNDINDERFDDVLEEYVSQGFVKILDYRGKSKIQMMAFNHCYQKNKHKYDYFIYFDMDEFIYLKNYNNIKEYLSQNHFEKCNVIYFNHVIHTDNQQIFYKNNSLTERFPEIETISRVNHSSYYINVLKDIIKSILKGNLENITIVNPHTLVPNITKGCNGFGNIIHQGKNIHLVTPDYKYYYYDHYYFKSSEEFLLKLTKGDVLFDSRNRLQLQRFFLYFAFNKISEEKLNYFEKETGLDFQIFRNVSKYEYYKNI